MTAGPVASARRRRQLVRDWWRALGACRDRRATRGEDGFLLLETVVAIGLTTIIMGALTMFFVRTVSLTDQQRARQAAAQVATSTLERLRALPASDLVTGRDQDSVTSSFDQAPASVKPSLTGMTRAVDSTNPPAGSGATATVPTSPTSQTLNNVTFEVRTYLGYCSVAQTSDAACSGDVSGVALLRAVVAVTWSNRACSSSPCSFVASTLISQDGDPTFNTNQTPPTPPVVSNPGNQTSTVGSDVSLQLGTEPDTGVPPLAWQITAGSLPAGLTMSNGGSILGRPTTISGPTSVTVGVTDAFSRSDVATFTWRVVAAPSITTPGTQSSTVGQSVSLALAASCPHTPCTYSLANAPTGLAVDAATGTISGKPATPGTSSSVVATVTDADGIAASTAPFTWKVQPAPTISGTGTLSATVGSVESVGLVYTCPTATCTLVLTGGVPGLGLTTSASTTGNTTATTLVVSGPSGSAYLGGSVQASAVPSGTTASYAPRVKITDGTGTAATSAGGTWTIFKAPSVGAPGTRAMTVTAAENVATAYTCPNAPCTLTLANPVPGVGLSTVSGSTAANSSTTLTVSATSGTVYLNGTVAAAAVPSGVSRAYPLSLTIVDTDGASTSASGTWTAYAAPTVANPGSQAVKPGATVAIQITASCPNGGCSYQAEARQNSDPTFSPIAISSSGKISYTNAPSGSYVIRVTATDADGVSATTTFALTVKTLTLSVPNQTTTRPTSGTKVVTLDVAALVDPQADGYTYVLSGQPGWLSIDADGLLTATITSSSSSDNKVTVTVTSTAATSSSVADTFSWTLR